MEDDRYIEVDGYRWRKDGVYYKRHERFYLHRHIWEKHNGPIPKGYHIHHKDNNKINNDIANLECLSHSEHNRRHWKENFEKMREASIKNLGTYARTDMHKEAMSTFSKDFWKNKKRTQLICPICENPYTTKMPETSKTCRKCQKDGHYQSNHVERECMLCNKKFQCYKYSKTSSCSSSCAQKLVWMKKRGKI